MEYEKIKKIIDDMGESKLTGLELEFPDGTKIKMKKEEKQVVVQNQTVQPVISEPVKKVETPVEKSEEKISGKIIKSPMVGTFYLKSSPTSEPYVEVGKTIKKGTVVCIVEAMKLMNEIESEYDGEVLEILVEDGAPVEYGKPLFIIK